jgi:hypothetical protein
VLVLAFAGAALIMRRAPTGAAPPATVATAAPPAAAPQAPEAPPAVAEEAPPPAPPATAEPPPAAAAAAPAANAEPEEVEPAKDERAAAWARLATGPRGAKTPVVKIAAKAVAKPTPKPVVAVKKTTPATIAAAGSGPCVMSVGSKPPADVWLDEKNLGRRTPLAAYHLACGDHKLVLKRADLDIYQMEMITVKPGAHFKKVYPLQ